MIERYTLPAMKELWSDANRYRLFQEVQALVAEGWAKLGAIPSDVAESIRQAPALSPEAVRAREEETRHDTAAFLDLLAEAVGPGGEWVHYGLTSSDMLDTTLGRLLAEATDLLLDANRGLFEVVKGLSLEHRATLMVGRTHGIWAEPTTFGLKLANWAFEIARNHQRLLQARTAVAVGKVSGVVGTYAHVTPGVEEHVCSGLGLEVEPASSQITMRDRHAQFLTTLALVGSSLDRFATEIRNLARSEIGEVNEAFGSGQKGSSAMPHKRNPVLAENVSGLSRLLRGYAVVGLENVALWHERDISHSSTERVTLPDASTILHFALHRTTDLIGGLIVNSDRMAANLESTRGLVYSQKVLLALVEAGRGRDDAYRLVQTHAQQAVATGTQLRELLAADDEVGLSATTLDHCFNPVHYLRNAEVVFSRLEMVEL
jgi:adenylosuccinate lyase